MPCQAFQGLISFLGLAPLEWGCWGFVLPDSTCPTFKRTLWNALIFSGAAEAVARIRTGTCSCLEREQFSVWFYFGKKKSYLKYLDFFLNCFSDARFVWVVFFFI